MLNIVIIDINKKYRNIVYAKKRTDDFSNADIYLDDYIKDTNIFTSIEDIGILFSIPINNIKYKMQTSELVITYFEDSNENAVDVGSNKYLEWTRNACDLFEIILILKVKFMYEFTIDNNILIKNFNIPSI